MTNQSKGPASLSMTGRFMLTLALLTTLALVASIVVTLRSISTTEVDPGQEQYYRDVLILFDITESPDQGQAVRKGAPAAPNFDAAKNVVEQKVFPHLGPGDRIGAYSIGTGFSEATSRIFGDIGLPPAPEAAVRARRSGLPPDDLRDRWLEVDRVVREVWGPNLTALQRQRAGYSDYFHALQYAAGRLGSGEASLRYKGLIVIGDLHPTPSPVPFVPPPAEDGDRTAFTDIEVTLVYPYRAGLTNAKVLDVATLQAFWRQYFAERGNPSVEFRTFDDPSALLIPSAVERPSAAG